MYFFIKTKKIGPRPPLRGCPMFLVFPLLATACTWFAVANQVLFPLEGEGRGGRACAWGWWRRRRPGRGRRGFKRGSFFPRATTVERPRGGASSAARRPRSARGPASPRGGAGPPPNPMYLSVLQHPLALALAEVHASGSIDEKKRQSTGNVFHLDCSLFRFEPQKAAPPKFSKYKTNGAFLDFQCFPIF